MEAAVIVAMVMAAGSVIVAVVSGTIAYRSGRATERLRQSNEARSRLHVATGSLQLELFLDTRSFARRLIHYHLESADDHALATERGGEDLGAYHAGGLMIYRLLRPLTVGEIVEKQTFAADLLLDPAMVDLLRFSHAGVEMLTGDKIGEAFADGRGLPGFDMAQCWDPGVTGPATFQRIRGSYLRCAAAALLAPESAAGREQRRCITHAEFCRLWEHPGDNPEAHEAFEPLKLIVGGFNRKENPIFWLRLVGYAYVCQWFYDRMRLQIARPGLRRRARDALARRAPVRYKPLHLPVSQMLRAAGDDDAPVNWYLADHADDYSARFEKIVKASL